MVFCRLGRRGFSSAGGGRRVRRASGFCGMVADTTFVLFIILHQVPQARVFLEANGGIGASGHSCWVVVSISDDRGAFGEVRSPDLCAWSLL